MFQDKIEAKLDRIELSIASIDKTLAVNTEQLAEHMRRTLLIENQLKPIQEHVNNVKFIGRLGMWAVGSGGVLTVVLWVLFGKRL